MSSNTFIDGDYHVSSDKVSYEANEITSTYTYQSTKVVGTTVTPVNEQYVFKTDTRVPKLGLMLVGWGGNNGSTVTAGILANKKKMQWTTKEGVHDSNYLGSLTQASTVRLGLNEYGDSVYIPFKKMLPMVEPNDLVLGGWDISSMNLGDAMKRAQVLDIDLQKQLYPAMSELKPLPSIYAEHYIALNQSDRADNVIKGNKANQLAVIRQDIRDFKAKNGLDKVIVLWTATTECCVDVVKGINSTAEEVLLSIETDRAEISPSTIFAVASILEGSSYINGSPQNTLTAGVVQLAERENVFICGDDFKSGQTKMKSVLVDFLVSAGIKPTCIVSYNHLGNNDGKNLSAPEQFRSKEISKSNVVDDMVDSNRILYKEGERPDHCVVIKYVPYVADSKRALDEYTSEIFMGGKNTIVMHNTCEDSLLATPLIIDLAIICEVCERIQMKKLDAVAATEDAGKFERFHAVLSLLSYLLKAPMVPAGTPVVNALAAQRQCIINVFRACVGLPPDNYMLLEHRVPSLIQGLLKKRKLVAEEADGVEGKTTSA